MDKVSGRPPPKRQIGVTPYVRPESEQNCSHPTRPHSALSCSEPLCSAERRSDASGPLSVSLFFTTSRCGEDIACPKSGHALGFSVADLLQILSVSIAKGYRRVSPPF